MESAAEFTAVPGWGGVAMGITALVARGQSPRGSHASCLADGLLIEASSQWPLRLPPPPPKRIARILRFFGPGRNSFSALLRPLLWRLLTFALFQRLANRFAECAFTVRNRDW